MKRPFSGLHARAFCHATEDLEKVELALRNTIGDVEVQVTQIEGHHGNPIAVVEASVDGMEEIARFFERLSVDDLRAVMATLPRRVDEGCNLFLRIDKQAAYQEKVQLGEDGDVISIRVRVVAYPARREAAQETARSFIESVVEKKGT